MDIALDHFILEVADPAGAARWFAEQLGLPAVRLAEFERGEVPFASLRVSDATIIDLFPRRMWRGATPQNTNHICFAVAPEAFTALRARVTPVRSDDHNFGARGYASSIYLDGPEGISVEVRAYFLM